MRIAYLSDIHTEFGWAPQFEINADVLVLAGDIGSAKGACAYARSLFAGPIVQVAGNHEHYGSRYDKTLRTLREQALKYGIEFLENDTVNVLGRTFIGATLWTDYAGGNPLSMLKAEQGLNDFRRITYNDHGRYMKLRAAHILEKHRESRQYIVNQLQVWPESIVVTHHAPTFASISPDYIGDPLNGAYASALEYQMEGAALWFHGHMHHRNDYWVGDTHVLSNPVGYPGQNDWAGVQYVGT